MLSEIYFASWDRIIYLPIFLILILLFLRNYFRVKKVGNLLVSSKHANFIFPGYSLIRIRFKLFLIIMAIGSLFVAFLRPQWNEKEQKLVQEGRDLLIILDVSRSMLSQDIKPNRLEFSKLKIRKLLDKLSFERVGLILFSGTAFIFCPLTVDYSAFLMFLSQVDTESISSGTTVLDQAIMKAIEVYSSQKNRKNKLVLLISDGEDFSKNLKVAKQRSQELGLKIFALGVGSHEGAPIPIINEQGEQHGYELDQNGKPILSILNESLLKEICKELNGMYFRIRYDDFDLDELVSNIEAFEKEKFEERNFKQLEDQYPWFIGATWLFLLLEWII